VSVAVGVSLGASESADDSSKNDLHQHRPARQKCAFTVTLVVRIRFGHARLLYPCRFASNAGGMTDVRRRRRRGGWRTRPERGRNSVAHWIRFLGRPKEFTLDVPGVDSWRGKFGCERRE
jgi:hypothetical protein